MDSIKSLKIFVRLAENGSFSKTARELSLGQASVSKQISALEKMLKTKLISRTTRQLKLTEAGEKFKIQASAIVEQYDFVIGEFKELKAKPSGLIRLSSTNLIGREYIVPILAEFNKSYPEIVVDHYLSEAQSNLVLEGIDLTIRLGEMTDSTHRALQIGALSRVTVASKDFLKHFGVPKHPLDLERFPCVTYNGAPPVWDYQENGKSAQVKVTGPYRANNTEALKAACMEGLGIFRGSTTAVEKELKDKKLVEILSKFEIENVPVFAVTPGNKYLPEKVKVLISFLQGRFKNKKVFNPKL